MRLVAILLGALLVGCADEPGVLLCVDADGFAEGDHLELQVTFASSATGPTCAVIRRAAQPLPYCVAATRGEQYAYAMALQAVWTRGGDEVGRRATVVPYVDDELVEADLVLGDCCSPPSADHQCVGTECSTIPEGVLDFFDRLVEPEAACEQ